MKTFIFSSEIRTIPTLKSQLHPVFLSECTRALSLCNNLQSFQCTVNAVPPLLPSLQGKERLQDLRIYANLTTLQSEKLAEIANLTNLCLDFGSWNVLDVLPRWTPKFAKTLTSLCLYVSTTHDSFLPVPSFCSSRYRWQTNSMKPS